MYDYSAQLAPEDRWAIAAYIRALQLSQRATVADVPPDHRPDLDRLEVGPSGEGSGVHSPIDGRGH
jgi:hypothetical protein